MKTRLLPALVAAFLLPAAGCALVGIKKKEVPQATLPAKFGSVVMVDSVHRFALVDTGAAIGSVAGARVMTFRDKQRTAALRVTGEARPPYVALEILEGEPAIGDQALLDESRPLAVKPAGHP